MPERVSGRVVDGEAFISKEDAERLLELGGGYSLAFHPIVGDCMEPEVFEGEYALVAHGMQPGPDDVAFYSTAEQPEFMEIAHLSFVSAPSVDAGSPKGGRQVFIKRSGRDYVRVMPESCVNVAGTVVWHGFIDERG